MHEFCCSSARSRAARTLISEPFHRCLFSCFAAARAACVSTWLGEPGARRFGRIRELPLLLASRLQGQDPPSLGWTYYDSLGPASDGPACYCAHVTVPFFQRARSARFARAKEKGDHNMGAHVIHVSIDFFRLFYFPLGMGTWLFCGRTRLTLKMGVYIININLLRVLL